MKAKKTLSYDDQIKALEKERDTLKSDLRDARSHARDIKAQLDRVEQTLNLIKIANNKGYVAGMRSTSAATPPPSHAEHAAQSTPAMPGSSPSSPISRP